MTEVTIPNIDEILLRQQEESQARGNGNDRNEEESETPNDEAGFFIGGCKK
jgi:hypothetical protein